jgi:hypothetical protein
MEIGQVIITHVEWRKRFLRFLEGHEEMDAEFVERDTECEFGAWLYGNGLMYRDLPEYAAVVEKHKRFHTVAAQAVRLAPTLPPGKALDLVSLHSAFTRASTECVAALCALREVVGEPDR